MVKSQASAELGFFCGGAPSEHTHPGVCCPNSLGLWRACGHIRSSCENPSKRDKNSHALPYPLSPLGLDMFVCSALKLRAISQTLSRGRKREGPGGGRRAGGEGRHSQMPRGVSERARASDESLLSDRWDIKAQRTVRTGSGAPSLSLPGPPSVSG